MEALRLRPMASSSSMKMMAGAARRALAEVPPAEDWWTGDETMRSFEQFGILDRRATLRRFISRIEVRRVGKGHRLPVADRVTISWRE